MFVRVDALTVRVGEVPRLVAGVIPIRPAARPASCAKPGSAD
jgi:hypothetical protein